jgi:hypothetical protein
MKSETWSAIVGFSELQPGNATRYCLIVTPINGEKASQASGVEVGNGFLVTWMNGFQMPSMIVSRGMYVHESYVMNKMRVSEADASVLAEFINSFLEAK